MASPKLETFFILHGTTNVPATGLTPTFTTYKNDQGTNVTAPAITEVGGGIYKFTPVFADPARSLHYVVSTGHNPAYIWGSLRPEQWNADNADVATSTRATPADVTTVGTAVAGVATSLTTLAGTVATTADVDALAADVSQVGTDVDTILNHTLADEELVQAGGDAGRIVRRDGADHTTVLGKWDCLKTDGVTKDLTGRSTVHRRKV